MTLRTASTSFSGALSLVMNPAAPALIARTARGTTSGGLSPPASNVTDCTEAGVTAITDTGCADRETRT